MQFLNLLLQIAFITFGGSSLENDLFAILVICGIVLGDISLMSNEEPNQIM